MANYQENPSSNAINSFANGTEITGEIKSSGDVRIDGKLTGNIDIKGKLVIGPTGHVEGDIACSNCDVSGKIIGKVVVSELLSLKASANVEGDMVTQKLSIEPGAVFSGTCKMNGKQTIQTSFSRPEKKDNQEIK
ncbi:MAG: polymer-forming cytoskeletal protein [Bacteroidales bacterium]|nr:polymer-forming cytoskeletal protein [Bacteroidales bacterium]MBN2756695.1 polymer-forming cytoskeletal protein [Bacteroidales bacterium]